MAEILTEQATVYVGANRRYLTRESAVRSFAVAAIRRRCECCDGDDVTPAYTCEYHDRSNGIFDSLVDRFVAIHSQRQTLHSKEELR